jgi:hypothetical protein
MAFGPSSKEIVGRIVRATLLEREIDIGAVRGVWRCTNLDQFTPRAAILPFGNIAA